MTENIDDLIEDCSIGEKQTAAVALANALEEIERACDALGIDRRTSMEPLPVNSIEYRLRDGRNMVEGVKNELADDVGYDDI